MLHRTAQVALDAVASDQTLQAVYDYWRELRGARAMPSWSDVDMMSLPLEVVPWCSVIDVVEGGQDFVVRFWGTERVRLQAMDYTGRSVEDFRPPAVGQKVRSELSQVIEAGALLLFETWLADNDISAPATNYRMLRLPLGADETVSSIMCIPRFSANRRMVYDWFDADVPAAFLTEPSSPRL
jgi:hypothetical protein